LNTGLFTAKNFHYQEREIYTERKVPRTIRSLELSLLGTFALKKSKELKIFHSMSGGSCWSRGLRPTYFFDFCGQQVCLVQRLSTVCPSMTPRKSHFTVVWKLLKILYYLTKVNC